MCVHVIVHVRASACKYGRLRAVTCGGVHMRAFVSMRVCTRDMYMRVHGLRL